VIRIERILAPNPSEYTLEGTNTWIVGADPSFVIDPGPDIASHRTEVARSAGSVAMVLITHDHPDHAPGAAAFARLTGAPIRAFRLPGAEPLGDGRILRAGAVELVALHTPGHTQDHVALHLPVERAIFTGDAVLGRGTSFIDPPDGNLMQYLRSLRRMADLDPRTLYPGHGPTVFDAPAKLVYYLAHRQDRERQVLAALGEMPAATIDDLAQLIYADYPPQVLPLAARSVLAHLEKLESEGRVSRDGTGDGAAWSLQAERACARCGKPIRGRGRICGPCSLTLLQEGRDAPPEPGTDPDED
jgi:glyoxylase-like metal-dependent hydrolase (beta-lactamase superfamily II)